MKPLMHRSLVSVVVVVAVAAVGGCQPGQFTPSVVTVQYEPDVLRVTLYGLEPVDGCSGTHSLVANGTTFVGEVVVAPGTVIFGPERCSVDIDVPLPLPDIDAELSATVDEAPWSVVLADVNIDRAPRFATGVLERGARYEILQARPAELAIVTVDMVLDADASAPAATAIELEPTTTGASFVVPDDAASDNRLFISLQGAVTLVCEGIECRDAVYFRELERAVTVVDEQP